MVWLRLLFFFFFFKAEDGKRVLVRSGGLGDVYKRQVHHCADVPAHRTRNITPPLDSRCVSRQRAVACVQASHVHPRLDERANHFGGIAGRAKGADDLRSAGHWSIAVSFTQLAPPAGAPG